MASKKPHEVAKMREEAAKTAGIKIKAVGTGKSKHIKKDEVVMLTEGQFKALSEKGAVKKPTASK